jgi:DNA invertase Pin-like site-specific DNA recombinase
VKRQEQDCRELCARRGWDIAGTYTDNDISAYSGKLRPGYRRMLQDLADGRVNAIVAWHGDRLHRSPRELEDFITVVEKAQATVETVRAGILDLATPSGRMQARIAGTVARHESEHTAERIRRKHQEWVEEGRDIAGGRPFGYERDRKRLRAPSSYCLVSDHTEQVLDEPALIREAARRILAGEALNHVCRDWTDRGVSTVAGGMWHPTTLKKVLCSARISGRREIRNEGGRELVIGRITGTAKNVPPIITPTESDDVRALLGNPKRIHMRGDPVNLLGRGIALCGECGTPLRGNWNEKGARTYRCLKRPGRPGCGHIRVMAGRLEEYVIDAILAVVDETGLRRILSQLDDDPGPADELARVQEQLRSYGAMLARGEMSREEWEGARSVLVEQRDRLERTIASKRRAFRLDGLDSERPLADQWPRLAFPARRAVIEALIEGITVNPSKVRGGRFDSSRVEIRWRA